MVGTILYTQYSGHENVTITVTNSQELNDAIAQLGTSNGGTILLDSAGGPYSMVASGVGGPGSPILVKSLNSDDPAVVQDVDIASSSHLTLTGVEVDSSAIATTRPDHYQDIRILNSDHIEIVDNYMHGTAEGMIGLDDNAVQGEDLIMIRNSDDVTFSHNEVSNYFHAVSILGSSGVSISDNEIYALQGDGIRGGGVQDSAFQNNYMHDFIGTTQEVNHSDMIQLWGGFPDDIMNQNIEISGNILDAGNGAATQSILIQSEAFRLPGNPLTGVYAEGISVHDNLIYNGMGNGIYVRDTTGAQIYDNTVIWNQAASYITSETSGPGTIDPRIVINNAENPTVTGNISGSVVVNEVVTEAGNFLVDYENQNADNFIGHHFVNFTPTGDHELLDLQILPDSELSGAFGADISTWLAVTDGVQAAIHQLPAEGSRLGIQLSAEYSSSDGDVIDVGTSTFVWELDDGTTFEGSNIVHAFEEAGQHTVTLHVTSADGDTDSITRVIDVMGTEVFDIDFSNGGEDSTHWDSEVAVIDSSGTAFAGTGLNSYFRLDGDNVFTLTRANEQMFNLDTFSMDIRFRPQDMEQDGALLKQAGTMALYVKDGGALQFQFWTEEGQYVLQTDTNVLTDQNFNDINISYDSPAKTLSLSVNDEVVASTEATGVTSGGITYELMLGDKWAESAQGLVDSFKMTAPPSAAFETSIPSLIADILPGAVADVEDAIDDLVEVVEDIQPDVEPALLDDVAPALVDELVLVVDEPVVPETAPVESVIVDEPVVEETPEETESKGGGGGSQNLIDRILDFIMRVFKNPNAGKGFLDKAPEELLVQTSKQEDPADSDDSGIPDSILDDISTPEAVVDYQVAEAVGPTTLSDFLPKVDDTDELSPEILVEPDYVEPDALIL